MPVYKNLDGTTRNDFSLGISNKIKIGNSSGKYQFKNAADAVLVEFDTTGHPKFPGFGNGKLYIGKTDGTLAVANLTQGTNVTITNGDGTITIAATGSEGITKSVSAKTGGSGSPYSILAADSSKVFTNEGATEKVYLTLPTAVAGYTYTFIVQDADGMRIVANTGDTIRVYDQVGVAAGYCESIIIGSTITLVAINAIEWIATSALGVWTTA